MDISVVVPLYNEEESLPELYAWIERVMKANGFSYEVIFVNDGSTDRSWQIIEELSRKSDTVHGIKFRRNYGKSPALYCGFEKAQGDVVITMDADLQDPPSLLPLMLHAIREEGYDSVATRRVNRKGEPPVRSFFARMFYKLIRKMSDTDIVDGARDFRLMNRPFVDALLELNEYNRFSKGLFGWVGFRTKWIEFENTERIAGETKWSFFQLVRYSLDGMISFSTAPLKLASFTGMFMCIISFLAIIFIIVRQLLFGGSAFGWPSMACIVIFIGGIQLLCIGILGSYLSRTYMEVKKRPIYICKESNLSPDKAVKSE
mgnify:CR=1 FL=1